jgi:hypothetical protein
MPSHLGVRAGPPRGLTESMDGIARAARLDVVGSAVVDSISARMFPGGTGR